MKWIRRLLLKMYGLTAFCLMAVGFAGLFSRRVGFRIPVVSTDIIPWLDRYTVWGETLRGPAILTSGEEWFFLIVVGIVILLGIATAMLSWLLKNGRSPSST